MNFTFTQDQLDFQEAIASMLKSEVTADSIRARWSAEAWCRRGVFNASARAWPQFDVGAGGAWWFGAANDRLHFIG